MQPAWQTVSHKANSLKTDCWRRLSNFQSVHRRTTRSQKAHGSHQACSPAERIAASNAGFWISRVGFCNPVRDLSFPWRQFKNQAGFSEIPTRISIQLQLLPFPVFRAQLCIKGPFSSSRARPETAEFGSRAADTTDAKGARIASPRFFSFRFIPLFASRVSAVRIPGQLSDEIYHRQSRSFVVNSASLPYFGVTTHARTS